MQQLTSSEHGETCPQIERVVPIRFGTPSRVTAATVLDGMRKRVVGTIREVIAPSSRHKWQHAGKKGEGI
jgi:hypothetical protein